MRAETRAHRVAAAGLCVLLTVVAPLAAQPVVAAEPTAALDARSGSLDRVLSLPAVYADLAGRN